MTGSGATTAREARERALRPLGPRGEGWIGIQMLLEIGCLVVASLTGPLVTGSPRSALAVTGAVSLGGGVLLFVWGASHLGRTFSVWVAPNDHGRLTTSGPYRWARHPICTAQLFICAGWSLMVASAVGLLFLPVIAWYLDRFKLAREEQTLLARYPGYADYMRVVPHRMLPSRPTAPEAPPAAAS